MAQFFQIHPDNPQARLVRQAADIVASGGVIVFPTDSAYAIGCRVGEKLALERIRALRQLDKQHNFTLMCRDLSELASYAKVDNQMFRLLKAHSPGPYTFIMPATAEVPRRLVHPKRKTIGLRVPDNAIVQALIEELGEPLMSCSLIMPGESQPLTDPYEIRDLLEHQVELIVDGGFCGLEATTVVDLTGDEPELIRQGCGPIDEIIS
ncbi:Threonylcarbamoyl-AMP synthase [Microbulbifer aggregans]|uniref:Threonylcarbamoyl-AMP synthase n=1 Tax=Microbulbifer aggregans TaxID=1769779 RepID=A0A1C9WBN0_9GAMM|nr:L-threonylcarbamoyladenylate synthase [Microbulbifer aggregans]AOS98537.1 Threonylcarbamoyl-AMP synthase [Microbulbifer aggregans]